MSPRMDEVCWHHHSMSNIARYIQNRLKHLWRDPDADLSRLPLPEPQVATHYVKAVAGRKAVQK
jgi:hypothetical protein